MSKRKQRTDDILSTLKVWSELRAVDIASFTDIHHRLDDGGFVSVDVWPTTGRYYVLTTDYVDMGLDTVERGGEKGELPYGSEKIFKFLDALFYGERSNDG